MRIELDPGERTLVTEQIQALLGDRAWKLAELKDRIVDALGTALDAKRTEAERKRDAARLTDAWDRPPSEAVERAVRSMPRHGLRAPDEPAAVGTVVTSLHFALSETRSGEEAAAHQRRMETNPACVSSFGTLAETPLERELLWSLIGARCTPRRGRLVVRGLSASEVESAVQATIQSWGARHVVSAEQIASLREAPQPAASRVPRDEFSIWTHSRSDHEEVAHTFKAMCRRKKLYCSLKSVQPKHPIVQRRILLELAHELDDVRREQAVREWCEANLLKVSWHACIHAPWPGMDTRNFHAYVVYSQFPIERATNVHGTALNRWTFELADTLPPQPATIRQLLGNRPAGRQGAAQLIRKWRVSLADIQNRHLDAVGANRRYDPRSNVERGIGGNAQDAVRGGSSARRSTASGVPMQPSRADSRWESLSSQIAKMVQRSVGLVAVAQIDEGVQALRLITGLATEERAGSVEAGRLRQVVEARLGDTEPASAPTRWLSELVRHAVAALQAESWRARWDVCLGLEPYGQRVGALAAEIVESLGQERLAKQVAIDARPDVRVLLSHARRHVAQVDQARQRLAQIGAGSPDGVGEPAKGEVERFLDHIFAQGLTVRSVAGPRERQWLVRVRRQARATEAAEGTARAMRSTMDPDEPPALLAEWIRRHGKWSVDRDLRGRLEAESFAARLRLLWRTLTQENDNDQVQYEAAELLHCTIGQHAADLPRRAWECLPRGYQAEIMKFVANPLRARMMCDWREQAYAMASRIVAASESASSVLDLPENADKCLVCLRDYDEVLDERVRMELRRHEERSARWVGVGPAFVRCADPQVWDAVQGPLGRFPPVVRTRITRARRRVQADEWDQAVATVVTAIELNALACVDPELAASINEARQRVEEALRQRLRRLRTNVAAIRATSDPRTRSELCRAVESELVADTVRDALSRREWMRLARDAGLRRVESVGPQVRATDGGG